MPVDIFSIDQLYPTFTGEETNTEKIERLADYLYKLIESLRYTLYHLGEENFSGGFDELKKKIEADIGTEIDLSDYVKQEDLAGYATDSDVDAAVADKVTDTELNTALAGYAQRSELSGYVPTSSMGDNSVAAGANLSLTADGGVTVNASGTAPGLGSGIVTINGNMISINTSTGMVSITAGGGLWVNGNRIA